MKRFWMIGASLGLLAGKAFAVSPVQLNIAYSALPPTPSPSTIVLTALGLLITFAAYWKMRNRSVGRPLAAILFAIGLGLVQMNKASANAVPTESMTGPGPLQFTLGPRQEGYVVNNTGVSQQITGITLNPNPGGLVLIPPADGSPCTVGLTLANGAGCYVEADAT